MIHEFALDPEALSNWPSFRYIVGKFGIPQGRLISRFPKEWIRLVHDASSGASTIERHRITEALSQIKEKMINTDRSYERNTTWIENAKRSHRENPFRLIISKAENANNTSIVDADTLSDGTAGWNVDSGPVPRNAKSIADAVRGLVSCSKVLVFVDPHFSCSRRHLKPLEAMLGTATNLKSFQRIEYHLACGAATDDFFETKLKGMDRLQSLLGGAELKFFRWDTVEKRDAMHARYVLTERGGLRFDYGLDEGSDGETTDVSFLSREEHRIRFAQYCSDSSEFRLADSWSVKGSSVTRLS